MSDIEQIIIVNAIILVVGLIGLVVNAWYNLKD
jgi:hypothetical protein